jgi:hypothetical protein
MGEPAEVRSSAGTQMRKIARDAVALTLANVSPSLSFASWASF